MGSEPSQFHCTPEEMLERLDRFPDAVRQVREIMRHYGRIGRERENDRILDLARKAVIEQNKDANKELGQIMIARARGLGMETAGEEYNAWVDEEVKRLKQRASDSG